MNRSLIGRILEQGGRLLHPLGRVSAGRRLVDHGVHLRPFSAWRLLTRSPTSSSTPKMPGALRPRLKTVTRWPPLECAAYLVRPDKAGAAEDQDRFGACLAHDRWGANAAVATAASVVVMKSRRFCLVLSGLRISTTPRPDPEDLVTYRGYVPDEPSH